MNGREKNERIDREIIKLISERSRLFVEEMKARGPDGPFGAEDRGRLVRIIEECNQGPLSHEIIQKIYTEILSGAMTAIAPVSVAFLGPEGTFTAIAVRDLFGDSILPMPQRTIKDVFREVEAGTARYGVVPIENSTEGSVTFTLDELVETALSIIAEQYVRVSYHLLAKGGDLSSIKKVYSHPQTLGQCKGWLRTNLPNAETVSVESTARAAEIASREEGAAAISSELAAGLYELNTISSMIEDSRQNYTRFFLMGRTMNRPTGNDKTSIVCAVRDKPGALLGLLRPFSDAGINMTKIESRPDKKKMWEYNFFIDFQGHVDDAVVKRALEQAKKETIFLKILGSYPVGS